MPLTLWQLSKHPLLTGMYKNADELLYIIFLIIFILNFEYKVFFVCPSLLLFHLLFIKLDF